MPSLTSIAQFLLLSSLAAADDINFTIDGVNDQSGTKCPGVLSMTGTASTDGYCCVGGQLTLSDCAGWPICSGPTTIDTKTATPECSTTIQLGDSDYSALITSASSQFFDDNGLPKTMGGDMPEETGSSGDITEDGDEPTETGSGEEATGSPDSAGKLTMGVGGIFGVFMAVMALQ